jgi:quercetin dioxygenase-like cupin family protein
MSQRSTAFTALLLVGLCLSIKSSNAQDRGAAPKPAHVYPGVRTILSTGNTVTGEAIHYPAGAPARIAAVEITLQPGQQTGWHTHPVPLFGYVLEGELTIDYGPKGKRVFRKGDALAEAMNEPHNGRNTGQGPMRILAVFMGSDGLPNSTAATPPAR